MKQTRSGENKNREATSSYIDHMCMDTPEKVKNIDVSVMGTSDHMGISVTKNARIQKLKPRSIKKKSYDDFNVEEFLIEIWKSDII